MKRQIAVLLVFLMMLGTISAALAANEVTVSGSSTAGPLVILCADDFNVAQSDYHASVSQTGTGAGITSLGTGQSDIAMASREVTSEEKSKYGDKFQETLIGYDGIAICVSKAIYGAGVTSLTKDQIRKIYDGTITNWKELGGPDQEIYVISREQGSGTRDTFLEDIFGDKKVETPGVDTFSSSNSEIKTAITGSDYAIGYLGYSYSESGKLNSVKVEGVEINPQTIKDKTYPLARKLYLDTLGDPKPGAQAFIDYVKGTDGQRIATENGFIPL
jgi:phosphate transport system substrate-binding protein